MNERTSVVDAQRNLLESYLASIRDIYENSSASRRMNLLSSLDKLEKTYSTMRGSNDFDHEGAKKVRTDSKLTLRQLASQLGIRSPQTIGYYENGVRAPRANCEAGKKYLEWLASKKSS